MATRTPRRVQQSTGFTNLGKLRQQQADYYAQAEEMGVKPPVALDTRRSQAGSLYMDAAKEAGKSYVQKGLPEWMKKFDAEERPEMRQANTDLAAAIRFEPIQQAEGATLRRWT